MSNNLIEDNWVRSLEVFWKWTARGGNDECWQWLGKKINNGAPQFSFRIDGRYVSFSPKKIALKLIGKETIKGEVIIPMCENNLCVNPKHLIGAKDPYKRWCPKCKQLLLIDSFNVNKQDHRCKNCIKEYDLEHHRKPKSIERTNKHYKIRYILTLTFASHFGCSVCGEKDPVVLQFDHIKDKIAGISAMIIGLKPIEDIKAEIDKCQILCANCHSRKTAKERGFYRGLDIYNLPEYNDSWWKCSIDELKEKFQQYF